MVSWPSISSWAESSVLSATIMSAGLVDGVNVLEENSADAGAAEVLEHNRHRAKFTIVHASHKAWPYFYYRIRIAQRVRVELVVPPWSNSVEELQQILHGWDVALDFLRHDESFTVDDIAQCFARVRGGEL